MQPRSTRLNADNKAYFVKEVLEKHLPQKHRPCDDDFMKKWVSKVYDLTYGPYLERMKALPEWFFVRSDILRLRFVEGDITPNYIHFALPKRVLVLNPHSGYSYRNQEQNRTHFHVEPNTEFYNAFKQHRQNQKDFDQKQRELKQQLHDLVGSCNTSGQLYKAWPEALAFAYCFPYKGPKKHTGAKVSAVEMDIGLKVSKVAIKLPEETS